MKENIILYAVVPCYNEEEVLNITANCLKDKLEKLIEKKKISKKSKILFVNDGSKDNTWNIIEDLHKKNNIFCGIKLSRNRGSQRALYAGLMVAKKYADVAICIEADLQDDINVIDKMIEEYQHGAEIVYGVRSSRKKDTFFKKVSAGAFYKFMNLIGVEMVVNHSECRLMSKKALEGLEQFKEYNLFLRGIIPQIGYQTAIAYYDRGERVAGKTKFSLKKMIEFALEGITSFSIAPLRLISFLGFLIFAISFVTIVVCIIINIINNSVTDLTFILTTIFLIGSIQLIALGIIGEYIGKMNTEIKERPRYIIEKELID